MAAITQRALVKGSQLPPLKPGVLRLYSMRFCPYAQRTRMVLAHKQIPHETVNVNLRYKPDWLLERNPLGLVPVLEQDDEVVYESGACDDYLDERFPRPHLTPTDTYTRARHRGLMDMFATVVVQFYRIMRGDGDEKTRGFKKMQRILHYYEAELRGTYFGGEEPAMLDFHTWPWFERMEVMTSHGVDVMPAETYPRLVRWTAVMKRLPAVRDTYMEPHMHDVFFRGLSMANADYDYGLQAQL